MQSLDSGRNTRRIRSALALRCVSSQSVKKLLDFDHKRFIAHISGQRRVRAFGNGPIIRRHLGRGFSLFGLCSILPLPGIFCRFSGASGRPTFLAPCDIGSA
jgi:hypothetical protein